MSTDWAQCKPEARVWVLSYLTDAQHAVPIYQKRRGVRFVQPKNTTVSIELLHYQTAQLSFLKNCTLSATAKDGKRELGKEHLSFFDGKTLFSCLLYTSPSPRD